jgi:hypothetical protein
MLAQYVLHGRTYSLYDDATVMLAQYVLHLSISTVFPVSVC